MTWWSPGLSSWPDSKTPAGSNDESSRWCRDGRYSDHLTGQLNRLLSSNTFLISNKNWRDFWILLKKILKITFLPLSVEQWTPAGDRKKSIASVVDGWKKKIKSLLSNRRYSIIVNKLATRKLIFSTNHVFLFKFGFSFRDFRSLQSRSVVLHFEFESLLYLYISRVYL